VSEAVLVAAPDRWERALEALSADPEAQAIFDSAARHSAYDRYLRTSANRERPGRYWKIDLDALAPSSYDHTAATTAHFSGGTARGVVRCDLATATREHRAVFEKAFGKALAHAPGKYAALAQAFVTGGAFVYIPPDVCVDEPIIISYRPSRGSAAFPYTLIVAAEGSSATVIEQHDAADESVFVCGVTEVIARTAATVTHAAIQTLPEDATVFFTRAALTERNARVSWAAADLGAHVCGSTIFTAIEEMGAQAHIAALFFPHAEQHVDFVTTTDHLAGQSQSRTLIKSAATGNGQARYLGNIRIAANMHGCDANLKDDALLLSPHAHIDSVPALEIAANDVKAFHGATVGALDEETVFYMMTRGLDRRTAERMIALGFFEPALDHFPTAALRERLRRLLEQKITAA